MTLMDAEGDIDTDAVPFGIRRLQLDAVHGLRVNGERIDLRGACVHHDNGPLGAITHPAAEDRKVRLLKQGGFNAIRSAHNPASRALLDACDRHVEVTVAIEGPGELAGLGSGAARTLESFAGPSRRTHDGRLLAIVRPTGPGTIAVTATAAGHAPARTEVRSV